MSELDYSKSGLLSFLKQSALAGRINPATARSQRHAAEQLLAQLTPEEAQDLRKLDVDKLCQRFHKLQGSTIRIETMALYRDRLSSSLIDFFNWSENPDGFVSVGGENKHLRKRNQNNQQARSAEEQALEEIKLGAAELPKEILPIPLRKNLVVYIQNLPLDLSTSEAEKISRVVLALASDRCSEQTEEQT